MTLCVCSAYSMFNKTCICFLSWAIYLDTRILQRHGNRFSTLSITRSPSQGQTVLRTQVRLGYSDILPVLIIQPKVQ